MKAKKDVAATIKAYEMVLDIRRQALGEKHPLVAQVQLELARAWAEQQDVEKSRALANAAFAVLEACRARRTCPRKKPCGSQNDREILRPSCLVFRPGGETIGVLARILQATLVWLPAVLAAHGGQGKADTANPSRVSDISLSNSIRFVKTPILESTRPAPGRGIRRSMFGGRAGPGTIEPSARCQPPFLGTRSLAISRIR